MLRISPSSSSSPFVQFSSKKTSAAKPAMKKLIGGSSEKGEAEEVPTSVALHKSFRCQLDEKTGQFYISFNCTAGKGTSPQEVPVEEYDALIRAVSNLAENGVPEKTSEKTAAGFMKNSLEFFQYEKEGEEPANIVSFRTSGGKGVKPSWVRFEDIPEIINFFQEITSNIYSYFGEEVPEEALLCFEGWDGGNTSEDLSEDSEDLSEDSE